jgi:hypothetical protein
MAIQHMTLAYWASLHVMMEHALRLVSLYQVSFDIEAGTVMLVPSMDAFHDILLTSVLIALLLILLLL